MRLPPSLRRLAVEVETPQFARTLRILCLFAAGLALVSEVAAHVLPGFPRDLFATSIFAAVFAGGALLARPDAGRRRLGGIAAVLFAVLGWYLARAVASSGGFASPHQGAVYLSVLTANALLPFSVVEFAVVTALFSGSFVGVSLSARALGGDDLAVVLFYLAGTVVAASIGILSRTRLQLAEKAARQEQERLNRNLRAEVEAQVERIRRSELLGRYLPRKLAEAVMAGERGVELGAARREVTVLCAVPAGLLESLAELPVDRVGQLVDEFVSAMARVADQDGGVIERIVGPRVTVLFGAIDELAPEEGVRRAARLAVVMQEEANALLADWERQGLDALHLRLAVGLAAGPAVVGTFGSDRRAEYSAIGAAMTRAHRLAAEAVPGETRVDATIAARLEGAADLLPGPAVEFTPGTASPTFVLAPSLDRDRRARSPMVEAVVGLDPTDLAVSPTPQNSPWREALPLPSLAPGDLFDGRYRIEGLIGRGGMAVVYRARHVALDQRRAIKLLSPDRLTGPEAVDQLRAEALATARIHHPNVVRHVDFGRSLEGHYYLALDFVDGPSLAQLLLAEGALAEREAVRLGIEILAGLEAAHALDIIHRDLKPANVLLDGDRRARVTDFGLAQSPGRESGGIAGTPAYMAPERARTGLVDERTDLFSFGVTLYEMLSGKLPHPTRDGVAQVAGSEELIPLARRAPHVSPAVQALVGRCLAARPADRPDSAAELREALLAAHDAASARRATAPRN